MNRGLESGLVKGSSKGSFNGLHSGLNNFLTNKTNMQDPILIMDPKIRPNFVVNADNCNTVSGGVTQLNNLITLIPNQIAPNPTSAKFTMSGTSYTPTLVTKGLGGKNYMDFSTTGTKYMLSGGTNYTWNLGCTYIFVIERKQNGTYVILDSRDSSISDTPGDILLEVDQNGKILFTLAGGIPGSVTLLSGTAGINLLNDWSILTIKHQPRIDNGNLGLAGIAYNANPTDNKVGSGSALEIWVNGVEQKLNITTNTYTNSDYYNLGTYRMFDRQIAIGNKASSYANSGTLIAAVTMLPAFISKALQKRIENYYRWYYNIKV